jgi:hypothetical protein
VLRTLYAFETETAARLAWAGETTEGPRAFYLNDTLRAPDQRARFVTPCCELAHLVPDPTRPWGLLGLCVGDDGIHRDVVRFRSTRSDECETVLDGDALGRERTWYLAIRP